MLNKKEVLIALQALKQCRGEMVQDFLEHNPEIYEPSYKYENSPKLLELSMDKYFLVWLSNHWKVFICIIDESFLSQDRPHAKTNFANVFLELLNKWSLLKSTNKTHLNLGLALVGDMQSVLADFIKAGENADMLRNKLSVAMEKNRVIFERQINQLEN